MEGAGAEGGGGTHELKSMGKYRDERGSWACAMSTMISAWIAQRQASWAFAQSHMRGFCMIG